MNLFGYFDKQCEFGIKQKISNYYRRSLFLVVICPVESALGFGFQSFNLFCKVGFLQFLFLSFAKLSFSFMLLKICLDFQMFCFILLFYFVFFCKSFDFLGVFFVEKFCSMVLCLMSMLYFSWALIQLLSWLWLNKLLTWVIERE